MDTKFQQWLMDHKPREEMLWKSDFWNTYVFWRDRILPMFTDEFYKKNYDYKKVDKEIDANSDVVGEHWSKSILNPVMRIVYKGVTIVFRYNFYDYEIAVISDKPIKLSMNHLFTSGGTSFFYQGFPDEYKVRECYEDNKCMFIASVNDHYSFYTFMYLLQRQIHLNERNKRNED